MMHYEAEGLYIVAAIIYFTFKRQSLIRIRYVLKGQYIFTLATKLADYINSDNFIGNYSTEVVGRYPNIHHCVELINSVIELV